jgi:type 1 fimbria pilin
MMLSLNSFDAEAEGNVQIKDALTGVNIHLSGNIVALGCTVDPDDVNKVVNLGEWATKQLHYPYGHSEPVVFTIHLTGCSASGVTLAFSGTKDANDNTLLALNEESTASGIAVEIMDASRNRINMGDNAQRVVVDSQGDVVLTFSACYRAVAAPSAGTAVADSEFTLTYD